MGKPAGAGFAIVAFIHLLLFAAIINSVLASASDRMLNMVGGCDTSDQWQPFKTISCYRRLKLDPPKGWREANSKCADLGGHLAVIRTHEENDFIKNNMLPDPQHNTGNDIYSMWFGLSLQWATCDGCNNVQSARWVDDTPLGESEMLPKPITLLTEKSGKYPWLGGDNPQPWNPDRHHDDCAHYFVTQDFSVGDWGVHGCDQGMQWALCQKPASK